MTKPTPTASQAKRLRALIEAPEILVLPGVFDGFSTRLVSKLGYTAAFITGSGVSEIAPRPAGRRADGARR